MEKTILKGCKIRLRPNREQAAKLDLWRRRSLSLWNLLLAIEQAAYSGEPFRPEIGWREIWAEVVRENYAKRLREWRHGKTISVGKKKGTVIPPMEGPQPEAPSDETFEKIRGFTGAAWLKRRIWTATLTNLNLTAEEVTAVDIAAECRLARIFGKEE